MPRPRVLLSALTAVLLACGGGDASGPTRNHLDGAWTGSSSGITLSMTLAESGGQVNGSGSLTSVSASVAVNVHGTFSDPSVSLTLSAPGFQDVNFSGTFVDRNSVAGQLNGSGFTGFGLTINKD